MSQPLDGSSAPAVPASERDDIVVALEHAALVQNTLRRCGVRQPDATRSRALGLTRLTVHDIATVATRLATELPKLLAEDQRCEAGEQAAWGYPPSGPEPVDHVLHYLRAYFEQLHAGWRPTMGKNRFLGPVEQAANTTTGGTVSHGGGPDPEPASSPLARRTAKTGSGVTVGVVDTAIVAHPWLAGGYSARPDDVLDYPLQAGPASSGQPVPGHATFVAGLILDEAPGATVLARQVLGKDPVAGGTATQNSGATSWDVAETIVETGRAGVAVLNLSLVCYTVDGRPPLVLETAVDRLPSDVLVVACAGNHGDPKLTISDADHRKPAWPAALDDVVAVGSAGPAGSEEGEPYLLSPFTPPATAWIDVLAPGENLTSTYVKQGTFDGWAVWGGTSFSAARVSGRIARTMANENLTAHEAYQALTKKFRKAGKGRRARRPVFWDF